MVCRSPARRSLLAGPSVARGLLLGIVLVVAVTALVSGTAVASLASDEADTDRSDSNDAFSETDLAQSLDDSTLEGEVTAPPVHVGDRVVVGTDRGLYTIADGSIEVSIETRPVRNVVAVTDDRAIALVDDQHYPNVLSIDVDSGEVEWQHAHERAVYSRDVGQTERQVPAFDAAPIGDVSGDGTVDVALTAGRSIQAVDGASGDVLWTDDREYNVWTVAHADGQVFAGTQGGRVVALDAADGAREYATRIADPFENDRFGSVPRSVWDVEPIRVGGAPRLAASTESGDVLLLERDDGDVAWRESLIEWDEEALGNYYTWSREREGLPTYPGDGNFRNVELTVLEDETAARGLAAAVVIPEDASNRVYRGGPPATVYGIDAASGEVTWSAEDLPLAGAGPLVQSPSVRSGSILVPTAPEESGQQVAAIDPIDGSVGEPIELQSVPPADRYGNTDERGFVATDGDELVVASSLGDVAGLTPDGELRWSVPSLRSTVVRTGDVTGDGTDDALVTSEHDLRGTDQSRAIAVRDGTNGELAWSSVLGLESFFEAGGYETLRPIPSSSGGTDLLTLRQPVREGGEIDDAPPSVIEVRDGASGTVVESHELIDRGQYDLAWTDKPLRPQSMAVLGDVDGNGNVDVLLGTYEMAFVLDVQTGEVLWERTYEERPGDGAWQPVDGRRLQFREVGSGDDGTGGGSDGVFDVAVASPESGQLALLETDASGGDLSFDARSRTDLDGRFHEGEGFEPVGDRTGDGYGELLVFDQGADQPYKLYDPGAGQFAAGFRDQRTTSVVPTDVALTGDDRPATIVTEEVDENARVSVLAGTEQVWSERLGQIWPAREHADGPRIRPAAPAGDVTGDGTEELALATSSAEVGARVELYDVTAGERVETIELAAWEDASRERFPGVHAQRIPDQTGDDEPELGVVTVPDQEAGSTPTYYVVDPQAGEVLASGEGVRTHFAALGGGVGIFAQDGALTTVDVTAGVTLDDAEHGSPVELSWSFAEDADFVTTVAAGGRPVTLTTERSATLRLPAGSHTVSVEATRPDGVTVHDSVEVTATNGSSDHLLLYGATLASLLLLGSFGAVPALRRRLRG